MAHYFFARIGLRRRLLIVPFLLLGFACTSQTEPTTRQRNILIIGTDQLSSGAVGSYGNPHVETPSIDSLAADGVAFRQVYTPTPLCGPARAAYWTSLYPHQTGVLQNPDSRYQGRVPDEVPTLGSLFSEAGYHTIHFGKRHDSGGLRGFQLEPVDELPVEGTPAWPVGRDTRRDRDTTVKAVEFLKEPQEQPFLAVVDLINPHEICSWVGHNRGRHEDAPVADLPPLPSNFEWIDFSQRPLPVQYLCCSHRRLSQAAQWNEENYRHYLAAYNHYVGRVDSEIARILEALRDSGAAANTLVVVMSDHGDGRAGHRQVTKQVNFYEEVVRVPLIFEGPDISSGEMEEKTLVSLLDLLPTLCDYAGIEIPNGIEGRSLLPWLTGRKGGNPREYVASEWHTEYGATVSPGRMIRTEHFKYVHYLEGNGEEFFDLENDPGEQRTLVDDPGYSEELQQVRKLFREHLEATADPYFELEVQVDPRWRSHPPGYQNHQGPSALGD